MAVEVLREAMDREQLEKVMDVNKYVTVVVPVLLSDIIDSDLEGFLDLLSELVTASWLLIDITYRVIGVENDSTILLEVTGDVSECYEWGDEEEEEVEPDLSGNWMKVVLDGEAEE